MFFEFFYAENQQNTSKKKYICENYFMNLMKKCSFILSLTSFLCAGLIVVNAQDTKHIFNVSKAGQLKAEMTEEEAQTTTHLTVTGKINAKDFRLMRDSMPELSVLDLSTVNIAAMTGKGGTTDETFFVYVSKCVPEYAFCKKKGESLEGKNTLREVWLPANLFNIEKYAFHDCRNLSVLVLRKKTPPNLFPEALNDSVTAIFVPLGCRDSYRNHKAWEPFNIMEGTPVRATVQINTPGTLGDELLKTGNQPSDIHYLTVTGTLDEADFKLIRDFMPKLVSINLAAVTASALPDYTFSQKRHLMEIILPQTLKTIGVRAFSGCVRLGGTLVLPPHINAIGEGAFLDCSRLKAVLATGRELTVIGGDLFRNEKNKLIYQQK